MIYSKLLPFVKFIVAVGVIINSTPVNSFSQHALPNSLMKQNCGNFKSTQGGICNLKQKSKQISDISRMVLDAAAVDASSIPSGDNSGRKAKHGPEITFGSSGLKLNWYGMMYGSLAIFLGIFWYIGMVLCDLMYKVMPPWGNKTKERWFDPNRRLPITISHVWGMTVMAITGCLPIIKGRENLKMLYDKESKRYKNAMFVANHTSWMDIYFVAAALGWRNYKMVAKHELLKVPILGRAMRVSEHILLDRTSRRSQLEAFKKGVKGLKTDGTYVVTFAEGTRSKTGVLGEFKKGAFKMAQSAGSPIVPMSIGYAQDIQPTEYIFPVKPSRFGKNRAFIYVGKPIETVGKSDDELVSEVRERMIEHLPKSQQPVE